MSDNFWPVVVGAYLLGSVPSAYLAGKWSRGIDIRQYGSGNVGATNLMRFTSRRTAIPVVIFDSVKGMIMLGVAWRLGLGVTEQMVVGIAAIVGHNWPVFLRFAGGRGVITTMGVGFLLPLINQLVPLGTMFLVTVVYGSVALISAYFKRLPLGVFIIVAAFPLVVWLLIRSLPLTLGYLAMFLILVARRLTARQPISVTSLSKRQILANRLLFDRDMRDKEAWMSLVLAEQEKQGRLVGNRK
ncbi:MAG: glycerol-3-phosphate acyltransferase [Dehalococcoidales bacterium]|nr:glycerol-3-phosphate acyltransferase [Dehalococcoidales bacterium]